MTSDRLDPDVWGRIVVILLNFYESQFSQQYQPDSSVEKIIKDKVYRVLHTVSNAYAITVMLLLTSLLLFFILSFFLSIKLDLFSLLQITVLMKSGPGRRNRSCRFIVHILDVML